MKTKNIVVLLVCGAILMNSCNNSLEPVNNHPIPSALVAFNIGFAATTRTSTDVNFKTIFTDGDTVGVYVVKHARGSEASLQSSNNYVDNAKLVYKVWYWVLDDATPIYYPNDGGQLDFYAYYPYNAGVTDANAIPLQYTRDQSTDAAYNRSDLLGGHVINIDKEITVDLQFTHLMSLVQVVVGNTGTQFTNLSANLKSATANAFNLSTHEVSVENTATDTKMFRFSGEVADPQNSPIIYRALVPAQTITAGNSFFSFVRNGTETSDPHADWTSEEQWSAGKVNYYTQTLSPFSVAHVTYNCLLNGTTSSSFGISFTDGASNYMAVNNVVVEYAEGDSITLTPTHNSAYVFTDWRDGSSKTLSKENTYTFVATGKNIVIQANFTQKLNESTKR